MPSKGSMADSNNVLPTMPSSFANVRPIGLGLWGLREAITPTLTPSKRGGGGVGDNFSFDSLVGVSCETGTQSRQY